MLEIVSRRTQHDYSKDVVSEPAHALLARTDKLRSAFIVNCIEDVSGFAALREEWDALQQSNENSSVFMSWAWHHTWWTVFGKDSDKLCIVCVRLRGELIAVLPLYMRVRSWPRPTVVMFLGTGEGDADEVATEYLDMVARPGMLMAAAVAALEFLDHHGAKKRFEFQHLLTDSVLVSALRCRSDSWVLEERDLGVRYRVDLQAPLDEIPMVSKRAKRVKRSMRAADRDGGLLQSSIADVSDVESAVDTVSVLSDQRQQHIGRAKSAFASEKFNLFHHRLLPILYLSGSADVQYFYLNDELAAVLYCFYDERSCHYYQSGFEQSMANRYMPLSLAHLMEIERNRNEGRRYYDFMRGDVNSYKNDFLCERTSMITMVRYPSVLDRVLHETFTMGRRGAVRLLRSIGVSRRR